MNDYKYITTTLPYVNSSPHIGHALEFIQADALVRYFRVIKNHDVYFNVGLDEHGLKVYEKSKELGIPVQEYCDRQFLEWKEFCNKLDIKYSNFYRTSSEVHKKKVQKFWNDCLERGDLYKSTYSGKYCVGCESYKHDKDLVDGKCPDHNTVPNIQSEEVNWFFNVKKYKDQLIQWIESDLKFLSPIEKRAELINIIKESEDLSVSRSKETVPWGIEVPNDPEQTIYVWFEALLNYIFAIDYSEESFNVFWNDSIQLCGPDNIRFQGCLFQSFLASAGITHTKHLLVHGTVLDKDGRKISKSVGNVIDPIEQINRYGLEAVRYYALAGLSTYGNSSWKEDDLINICNADLGDNFGNLFARVLHLITVKGIKIDYPNIDSEFKDAVDKHYNNACSLWENFDIQNAIKETNILLSFGNKYINTKEPWKSQLDSNQVLNNLHYLLHTASALLYPVVPNIAEAAKTALKENHKIILFPKIK